jgi:hypothetical protein
MHPAHNKTLILSLYYYLRVFMSGTLCAFVRIPFLEPYLGERYAQLLEMPFMGIFIWKAARSVVAELRVGKEPEFKTNTGSVSVRREGLAVGLLALFWFLLTEAGMYVWINRGKSGRGWTAYLWGRDPVSGVVFFGMLAWFGALPGIMG